MLILSIESSCDDTSVALLDITDTHITRLAEKTASQIDIHQKYGGVIPELAGRKHAEQIIPLIDETLIEQEKPEAIAVTAGPGLVTGLLVGVEAAKNLAYLWDIPLIRVNHIDGHVNSVRIQEDEIHVPHEQIIYPAISLTVSGGHTTLMYLEKEGSFKIIGNTRDDAAGECFDKVAKMLGLAYPGGPKISKYATEGNPNAISFPRPMLKSDDLDMSFAGLKTAVRYWLRDNELVEKKEHPDEVNIHDFCASFEQAIVDVLVGKTIKAIKQYQPNMLILAGGVSANAALREQLRTEIETIYPGLPVLYPLRRYCMDNATMIGLAAYDKVKAKHFTSWQDIDVDPNWRLGGKTNH